jgi:hypothetical protein
MLLARHFHFTCASLKLVILVHITPWSQWLLYIFPVAIRNVSYLDTVFLVVHLFWRRVTGKISFHLFVVGTINIL